VGAFLASTAAAPSTASVGRTPLAQPIALTGHLHDGRVCQEAIEDRSRGWDVLPDPLHTQTGVELLGDRGAIERC